jgi:phosphomevalonate kinase
MEQILIILLSGKRYSGKGTTTEILLNHCQSLNIPCTNLSFSYSLKEIFCKEKNLDLDRFLTDHEYKDLHRNDLTTYYKSTDPIIYAEYIKDKINNGDNKVIIIDDLRNYLHLNFMKEYYSNIKVIRINSLDESKMSRGWFKTEYDNDICENELDNYDEFDVIFDNDFTKNDLKNQIMNKINDIIQ